MIIERTLRRELLEAAAEYPVVTVLGPRQSGKTTLVRSAFPGKTYLSLESPDIQQRALGDPRGFLDELAGGAILDEVQRTPQLLSYIQEIVDTNSDTGQFILTGSHKPMLHQAVSQSLAGRTAVLNLMQFSLEELAIYNKKWNAFELCCKGFFPRLHDKNLSPGSFFSSCIQTYVERDVRSLMNLKNITKFQSFLLLLAGRTGQLLNLANISNDTGVSSTTVRSWIDVLKSSFMVIELPSYHVNIRKRVVRSPKIYFTDTGLLCYLLGIGSSAQLKRDPLRGSIYENLLIMEVLKTRLNKGVRPDLYFYRDSNGNEVDLLIPHGGSIQPVEIKSSSTFTPGFIKGISSLQKQLGDRCRDGIVFYNGEREFSFGNTRITNPVMNPTVLNEI
jgi:predicted AAA+ superfamily ATPase